MRIALGLALVLMLGCSKKGGKGGDFDEVEAKVAEVNARVPDAQKAELTFKAIKVADGRLGALVPASWVESANVPGLFTPAGKTLKEGYLTHLSVGSNCDGSCESKDWPSVTEREEFSIPRGDVVKDELLGGYGRILIKDQDGTLVIRLVRWKKGGSRYFFCKVALEADARAAADAFEAGCRAITPLSW